MSEESSGVGKNVWYKNKQLSKTKWNPGLLLKWDVADYFDANLNETRRIVVAVVKNTKTGIVEVVEVVEAHFGINFNSDPNEV